jgi:hypothetical protein
MAFPRLEHLLRESPYNGYPIVDTRDSMQVIGFVSRLDLHQALGRLTNRLSYRYFMLKIFQPRTSQPILIFRKHSAYFLIAMYHLDRRSPQ